LVGIRVRAALSYGAFDSKGEFRTPAPGVSEQQFEQALLGAVRVPIVDRLQIASVLPVVETRRSARAESEVGGGLGDATMTVRYDGVYAGERRWVPGIAMVLGVGIPTGRSVDRARRPLATDATGTGAWSATAGVAVEQRLGRVLLGGLVTASGRAARTVGTIRSALGTQWFALASAAYAWPSEFAVAATASLTAEGRSEVNGADVPGSSRHVIAAGLSGVVPLHERIRLQGALIANPPVAAAGQNEPAALSATLTAIGTWF